MVNELKMPKLKAYENGELEIEPGQENGWERVYPPKDTRNTMTHVFHSNYGEGVDLVITCSGLEVGDSVHLQLVPCLESVLHEETFLPDEDTETALGMAVEAGLINLGVHYRCPEAYDDED